MPNAIDIPQRPTPVNVTSPVGSGFGATMAAASTGNPYAIAGGLALDAISFGVQNYYNKKAEAKQLREIRRQQKAADRKESLNRAVQQRQFDANLGFQREQFAFNKTDTLQQRRIQEFQRLRQLALEQIQLKSQFRGLFTQRGMI